MVLPKVPYDTSACDGDPDNPNVTWQEYYGFRNRILRALREFGAVGPMGEAIINADEDGPPDPWPVESRNPDFFVVDDWYNNWSYWAKVETEGRHISLAVVESLVAVLRTMPADWAIGVSIPKNGYILLFADRFMVDGPLFENDTDLADVVVSCRTRAK
jgi:hypothetical protein